MIALHEKHGPVVRTGPTTISISDPSYIPKIYGIGQGFHKVSCKVFWDIYNTDWRKGGFYNALTQRVNRKPGLNLFTTKNPDHHAVLKKPVANAYAMSTLTEFEPFVDKCIVKFMQRLGEEFAAEKKSCNMADWLQYCKPTYDGSGRTGWHFWPKMHSMSSQNWLWVSPLVFSTKV